MAENYCLIFFEGPRYSFAQTLNGSSLSPFSGRAAVIENDYARIVKLVD